MRYVFGAATALAVCACAPEPEIDETLTTYRNGRVWSGEAFEPRDLHVRDGRIVIPEPRTLAATSIDVTDRFIVPAYGDAHTHVSYPTPEASSAFLSSGAFYAINMTATIGDEAANQAFYGRAETYDVITTLGGVTAPRGHPEALYREILAKYVFTDRDPDSFEGDAYHLVVDAEDIGPVLDRLESQGADLIKTYLLTSEEYALRRDDETYYGHKGLDPDVYPELIDAVHDRGLRAAVHVETAHDFGVAARAGVDVFAHLPAYGSADADDLDRYRISLADARIAADNGAVAIPTYGLAQNTHSGAETPAEIAARNAHHALQRDNVRTLTEAGVPIVIGTDASAGDHFGEARHLVDIGALTPTQALEALVAVGPLAFPQRALGHLTAGAEANFLILTANPSLSVDALDDIQSWVKAGNLTYVR